MLEKLNDNTATERVWKIARTIKRDYNLAFQAFSDSCSSSGSRNTFIRNEHFRENLLSLLNQSGIIPSTEINNSVTEDALNAASEIFIYLSSAVGHAMPDIERSRLGRRAVQRDPLCVPDAPADIPSSIFICVDMICNSVAT